MKISELPEGTIFEVTQPNGEKIQYELTGDKTHPDWDNDYISRSDVDNRDDIRVVSVPYEVTLKLAEWLDNVYTKTGMPENLIVEAAIDAAKTKHDSHISDRPKKD